MSIADDDVNLLCSVTRGHGQLKLPYWPNFGLFGRQVAHSSYFVGQSSTSD